MLRTLLTVILSVGMTLGIIKLMPTASQETAKESVYDRVMRTGTIRCGYTPYSVGFIKDPNNGAMSGIYFDIVQEIAKNLQLKVEYVEEVGWDQQIAGLESDRYDMMCSPTSLNAGRTRTADFSIPLYYSPVKLWVRRGDPLVNSSFDAFNRNTIKISVLDGEQTATFARNYFPNAQAVSLPQASSFSDLMMQVTTHKADVTMAEPLSVYEFEETNPDTLEEVKTERPLVIVPNVILLKRDQFAFKELIDNSLRELFNTGYIDRSITKYEKYPHSYIRETTMR
ncbi:MAG: substrate-binding periplasmic protein [Bdellovibrionales bacterium]